MTNNNLIADYLLAAQQGELTKLKSCLHQGVDINVCNRLGQTAITLASLNKKYECVVALLDAGADINKQDQTCLNPFLISCLNNDLTLLRLLLPARPDLNRLTRFGGVGLTPACEKGTLKSSKSYCIALTLTSTTLTLSAGRRCWRPSCSTTAVKPSKPLSACCWSMVPART